MPLSQRRAIRASLSGYFLVANTKLGAAALTGSSAMLSKGVHSIVDSGNTEFSDGLRTPEIDAKVAELERKLHPAEEKSRCPPRKRDGGAQGFLQHHQCIEMGGSSNIGNMFSGLGASIFLPFVPMTAIQVLNNNLLPDFSQTIIPTDNVDARYLKVSRRWGIGNITTFMLVSGPIRSLFDFMTFFTLRYGFGAWNNPALFHNGWFVESLLTQTLIIHIIRTAKIPFSESRASKALILTAIVIALIGIALPLAAVGAGCHHPLLCRTDAFGQELVYSPLRIERAPT